MSNKKAKPSNSSSIRGQSSLDAFFGIAQDKKNQAGKSTGGKQMKLDAFLKPKSSSSSSPATATTQTKKETDRNKSNVSNSQSKSSSSNASSPTATTALSGSTQTTTTSTNTNVVETAPPATIQKSNMKVMATTPRSEKENNHVIDNKKGKETNVTATNKVQNDNVDDEEDFQFVVDEDDHEKEKNDDDIDLESRVQQSTKQNDVSIPAKRLLDSSTSNFKRNVVVQESHTKRQRTNKKTYIDDDDDDDDMVDKTTSAGNPADDDDDEATVDMQVVSHPQNVKSAKLHPNVENDTNRKESSQPVKANDRHANKDKNNKDGKVNANHAPQQNDNNDDHAIDATDDDEEKSTSSATKPALQPKSKNKNTKAKAVSGSKTKQTTGTSSSSSSTTTKKSELAAKAMKSDQQLLEESSATSTGWEMDKDLPYLVLCQVLEHIEETSGRLEIQRMLTDLMRQVLLKHPNDMHALLYLASNSVAPAYECVELGIGDAILNKAIGEAFGTNPALIKKKYANEGDLGTVAKFSKSMQRTLSFGVKLKPLLAREVLQAFREIARMTGSKSQKAKVEMIKKLLVRAQPGEAKYVVRGLQGKLRIGLAQTTVLISLAHALALTTPKGVDATAGDGADKKASSSGTDQHIPAEVLQYCDKKAPPEKRLEAAVAIIKQAYSEVPSYDALLAAGLKVPLQQMHEFCTLTPGIPVSPMLAKPTKSIQEILKRLNGQTFTCEYKYDGERAQVHMLPDGTTKVFSRNLLDTSEKYPEVPLFVKEACVNVSSFVLDAEVVAFNNKTGTLVPFQVLSTRKKTEESADTAKVQVILQAFDLMFLNGRSLLKATLKERRELLHQHFQPVEGKFQFAKSMDHRENGDTTCIEEFLDMAVKGQCEGLMVKTLEENAVYEPSRRSLNWLKLKKDYLDGLGDSVDLVPLGAYHGKGKRTGVYGAYLLACYDTETEEFQSCCKLGTGFSDEDLKDLSDSLNKHRIPHKNSQYNVSDQLECDVWFDAVQVWEVKAADLSKSSVHSCAIGITGEAGRGIGLRFPRFVRVRDDKKPDQATTSEQVLEMYYNQGNVNAQGGDDVNEDYYAANSDDDGI